MVGQLLALVAVESKDLLLKPFLLGANTNLSRKEEPWLARLCLQGSHYRHTVAPGESYGGNLFPDRMRASEIC